VPAGKTARFSSSSCAETTPPASKRMRRRSASFAFADARDLTKTQENPENRPSSNAVPTRIYSKPFTISMSSYQTSPVERCR
jgi:hypothetical protein